jgi:hypothetical protein
MLDDQTFKIVINPTPLISIGPLIKNKTINNADIHIGKDELNIELKLTSRFIGVFKHFYDDSAYQDISTHYVNLTYEIEIEEIPIYQLNNTKNAKSALSNQFRCSDLINKYSLN